MSTVAGGMFSTEIYVTDDGLLAIEQESDVVVLLSADDLPLVIEKLSTYYEGRASWREATPG
jgi:hypothetical protein